MMGRRFRLLFVSFVSLPIEQLAEERLQMLIRCRKTILIAVSPIIWQLMRIGVSHLDEPSLSNINDVSMYEVINAYLERALDLDL